VSWGPLVEYSAKQSKIKKAASRLGRLFSHSSSAETRLREIIDDLRKELLRVRRVVYREQNLMKCKCCDGKERSPVAPLEEKEVDVFVCQRFVEWDLW
jgi:hypothetical protein